MSDSFKKFAFKKSALADKADKIWSESKSDFSAAHSTNSHIQLEKKSLASIFGKVKPVANEPKTDETEETSVAAPPSFVFGSKIADRIVQNEKSEETSGTKTESEEKTLTATELFKSAIRKDEEINGSKDFRKEAEQQAEREKEAEKQHASTSVIEVTTGEEQDTTIFQASCKLWVFDKERRQYSEKGICTLRINKKNDVGHVHHRIVARTSGTLRVVINSKIFSDMLLERPDKRIKISATGSDNQGDQGNVQIFLLKFGFSKTDTGAEADLFYSTMCDLLKLEKGENSRKRKADCDLNAEKVKLRDGNEEKSEAEDKIDEGFVIVEKPVAPIESKEESNVAESKEESPQEVKEEEANGVELKEESPQVAVEASKSE